MLKRKILIICLFLIFALGCNISSVEAVENPTEVKKSQQKESIYKELELLGDTITIIQSNYVEKPKSKDLIYGALKGMLSSLDLHSQFLKPQAYEEIKVETEGKFGGLGIVITIRDNILTVVSPLEDTPASRVGLKAGDMIVEIEGETTKDITLMEAVKKLRGEPGTKVNITVIREKKGGNKILDFTITRDVVKIKSIKKSRILEDNIGYIKLIDFQEDTAKQLKKKLKKLSNKGMDSLILDLRNNPGGLLDSAVDVAEKFITKGKLIVSTKGRKESQNLRLVSKGGQKYVDIPLVVLVNKGSASGSEIVAGAVQDYSRGIILGEKTFGKGSVQTVIPLSDGSALRLTTSKYFTPDGSSIHKEGIEPDIKVEYTKVKEKKGKSKRESVFQQLKEEEKKEEEEKEKKKETEKFEYDSQILRAIDLIKGIKIYKKKNSMK